MLLYCSFLYVWCVVDVSADCVGYEKIGGWSMLHDIAARQAVAMTKVKVKSGRAALC